MSINADTVIRCKLIELNPQFDFQGMDNTVYQMCKLDLNAYIDYCKENQMHMNNREDIIVPMVSGENIAVILDRFVSMCEGFSLDDVEDDRKAVESWVEWWYKQYLKRVKISFTDAPPPTPSSENKIISKFNGLELSEMKKMMKFKLIKNGEIVGTTILSDALLNRVMSQYSDKVEWNIGTKLQLTNTLLRESGRLAEAKGVLIYIRPTKKSYGIREFRDDGAIKQ
jgi:hypothetical protein